MQTFYLKIRSFFVNFFTIHDSPHKVAAGAALGLFMGILPGGLLTTLFLATIFRFNRLSATVSSVAFSFWTTAVSLPFAATLGGFIFGIDPQKLVREFSSARELGLDFFLSQNFWPLMLELSLPLFSGLLIVALFFSLAFYFFLYRLLCNNRLKFK